MVIIIPDRGIRNTYTHVDVLIDIVDSLVYRGPGGIDTYGNGVAAPVCFRFFFSVVPIATVGKKDHQTCGLILILYIDIVLYICQISDLN